MGLLIKLIRQSRGSSSSWLIILTLVLLSVPLSGFKLLLSSSGSMASSPGLVTIRNPEQGLSKLYYLQHRQGTWQVDWVAYIVTASKETVVELEGNDGLEVAYQQAGQWRYVPVQFAKGEATITFPQDFTAVDTSGHIAAAVDRHLLAEYLTWLSNLLTVCGIGLAVALVVRFIRRLLSPKQLSPII